MHTPLATPSLVQTYTRPPPPPHPPVWCLQVIHGDLTPANVLLKASRIDKRGFIAKVADFGLAKVTRGGVARTEDWCTAAYMAPEVRQPVRGRGTLGGGGGAGGWRPAGRRR